MDESILMNYLRGGCNDEECQQVELWCEEAPENRQILEQLYYTLFVCVRDSRFSGRSCFRRRNCVGIAFQ